MAAWGHSLVHPRNAPADYGMLRERQPDSPKRCNISIAGVGFIEERGEFTRVAAPDSCWIAVRRSTAPRYRMTAAIPAATRASAGTKSAPAATPGKRRDEFPSLHSSGCWTRPTNSGGTRGVGSTTAPHPADPLHGQGRHSVRHRPCSEWTSPRWSVSCPVTMRTPNPRTSSDVR